MAQVAEQAPTAPPTGPCPALKPAVRQVKPLKNKKNLPFAGPEVFDITRMGIYCNGWQLAPGVEDMSRKKISTTVYITPEQNERLHLLHTRTKVPVAVYIREGIDLVLKRYEHALPGQMTLTDAQQRAAKKKLPSEPEA